MTNPYVAPKSTPDHLSPSGLLGGAIAFLVVLAVAVGGGAIAPSVAHIAGAPSGFTTELLQISMMACIPFGIIVAYATSRCVRYHSRISRLCWFFAILLVVIPLAIYPTTSGPLLGYTGFALAVTIIASLVVSVVMQRFTRPARHG